MLGKKIKIVTFADRFSLRWITSFNDKTFDSTLKKFPDLSHLSDNSRNIPFGSYFQRSKRLKSTFRKINNRVLTIVEKRVARLEWNWIIMFTRLILRVTYTYDIAGRSRYRVQTKHHVSKRRRFCASKFRLKKERNIRSRTSRSTFPTSPHFPIFPNSFSIHSLSLSRERIESSDSFGSGSLSRFLPFYRDYYYKFVSSLIEMIFEFCYSRPVLSNLLFRVFRSRILLWDVNWKNLREGTNTNRNFSFHISHDAIKMERWTRKGRLIYHDLAS